MNGQSVSSETNGLWAIVLAGGEVVALRRLMEELYGEDWPEALATVVGSGSLLRQTLERVRLAVPFDRTLVATVKPHADAVAEALDGAPVRRVLIQPEDKGTAAALLLSAHWVSSWDPDATVAVFPSDHFIPEGQRFMDHVADLAEMVSEHPEWVILVTATPTEPEADYGWVEPGELVGWTPAGEPVSRVRRFWEKPSHAEARRCQDKGWLWSTFVLVAKASRLLEVADQIVPRLNGRLSLLVPFRETALEAPALQQAYALTRKESFARSVLEACPPGLMLSRLPPVAWSDWGTSGRVIKSLQAARLLPRWLANCLTVEP
ncbi:MAG: hypothetical protein HYY95_16840 [Candidatus Rokubacteria bacterium]|nr:hypothetical protein [Candidatus Rokubacteria bacterium]